MYSDDFDERKNAMLDMKELIPSKDVWDYMQKSGRVLTDFEKATLIYNHSGMSHEEKVKALKCIQKMTTDDNLREQIQKRLTYDSQCLKKFFEKENDEIYVLKVFVTAEQEWTECGYYISGELAVASGKKFSERFSVYKTKLLTEEKEPDECYSKQIAALYFTANGAMHNYYSNEVTSTESEFESNRGNFENAYIDIPHPFKNGDLVKVRYNELKEGEIYIVECCPEKSEDENIQNQRYRFNDYGDVSLRVATMDADAKFGHKHVKIVDIEFATLKDDDPKKTVLECAADLVNGCGSLSDFQFACEEYCRKTKMIVL